MHDVPGMQPLKPAVEAIADAVSKVGATASALLGGDERGHVIAHMTDHDEAIVELVRTRYALCLQGFRV